MLPRWLSLPRDAAAGNDMQVIHAFTASGVKSLMYLSAAILFLALIWFKSSRRTSNRHRLLRTTPNTQDCPACAMSHSKDLSLPFPSINSHIVELPPSDPLAKPYFPFTSGQLAALADRENAENQCIEDNRRSQSAEEPPVEPSSDGSEVRVTGTGYVQYFEDKEANEAWQRKVVVVGDNNVSST